MDVTQLECMTALQPANFAVCPGDEGEWKVLDFGIARRYVSEAGSPIPQRMDFNEFRGSTTYASINAHTRSDLGQFSAIPHASFSFPYNSPCFPDFGIPPLLLV